MILRNQGQEATVTPDKLHHSYLIQITNKNLFLRGGRKGFANAVKWFPCTEPSLIPFAPSHLVSNRNKSQGEKLRGYRPAGNLHTPNIPNGMDGATSLRQHNSIPGGRWNSVAYRGDGTRSMPANSKERRICSLIHSLTDTAELSSWLEIEYPAPLNSLA